MTQIHQNQPLLALGPELEDADRAVILLHGRGSTARAMLPLVNQFGIDAARYLIPQASSNRWYPNSAFDPLHLNQPDLNSALDTIHDIIQNLQLAGMASAQIVLGGFSQGACLAAEYTARHAGRYGGLFIYSGALIGPRGTPRDYQGSLQGTPVFLGSSDSDPWVSHDLVQETAHVLRGLGGKVDFRTYPGMGHTVNQDEIQAVRDMLGSG